MSKTQIEPTVYCIVAEYLIWHGKKHTQGATLEIVARNKAEESKLALHVKKGWLRVATAEDRQQALKLHAETAAPAPEVTATPAAATATAAVPPGQVQMVPLDQIRPDPTQPRKDFKPEAMRELVDSIRQKGVQQAMQLRPMSRWRQIVSFVARQWVKMERGDKHEDWNLDVVNFWKSGIEISAGEIMKSSAIMKRLIDEGRIRQDVATQKGWEPLAGALEPLVGERTLPGEQEWLEIVYGERRWRGTKEAGLPTIPAKVDELTDIEAAELQAIENLKRADLLPLEDAAQYRKLLDTPGYGMERLMATTGKAKNTIYGKLKLLDLPEDGIKAVQSDKLQASVGELIGRQEPELRAEALKRVLKPDLGYTGNYGPDRSKAVTVKEAEKIIDTLKEERKQAQLRKHAVSEAEGKGMVVLNEEESRSISHYSGGISPSCGYVGATDKCPRDPNGRTWRQVMKGQAGVKEYASIRWAHHSKSFGTTALYKRDEVNPVLKKLGLWTAEGSAKSKELEAQRRKKEKHGRDFERMQNQLDALSERAASVHATAVLRVALTALIRSDSESCYHAAKRRLLISADEKTYATMGQAQKRLRELVKDANIKVLSELVGDLGAISLATDNTYFGDGIKTVAALLGMEQIPSGEESADIRTGADDSEEMADAA